MGGGVSKTELRASAVSRELLRQERQKSAAIENRFRNLEEQFAVFREGMTCNQPSSSNQVILEHVLYQLNNLEQVLHSCVRVT